MTCRDPQPRLHRGGAASELEAPADAARPQPGPGLALTSLRRRVWTRHLWGQDTTTQGQSVSSCFCRRKWKCRQRGDTQAPPASPRDPEEAACPRPPLRLGRSRGPCTRPHTGKAWVRTTRHRGHPTQVWRRGVPARGTSTLLASPCAHTEARAAQDRLGMAFAGLSVWGLETMLLKHPKRRGFLGV